MIKLLDLVNENKILVPRRSPQERQKNYIIAAKKKIQQYIKDGSKGNLNLPSLKDGSILPLDLKVGGNLDLGGVTSIPNDFNPTVDGSLYLNKVTLIPKGFNPTVGGYLYLTSVTSHTKEELEKMLTNVKGKIVT